MSTTFYVLLSFHGLIIGVAITLTTVPLVYFRSVQQSFKAFPQPCIFDGRSNIVVELYCSVIWLCFRKIQALIFFFLMVKPNSPLRLYFKGCHIVIDENIFLVYEQDCTFLNVLIHISNEIPWLPSCIFIIFRRDREAALIGKRCKSAKRIRK